MALYDAAVSIPLVTVDRDGYLSSLGGGPFYDIAAAAAPGTPITVVADLPVEWEGSFDLVFTWDTIQFLLDDLLFSWTETAEQPIANGDLEFTWIETDALLDLVFTWAETPASLLSAYELDPQRPYGRVTKP